MVLAKIAAELRMAAQGPSFRAPLAPTAGADFLVRNFVNEGRKVAFDLALGLPGGDPVDLVSVTFSAPAEQPDCLQGLGFGDLVAAPDQVWCLCAVACDLADGAGYFPCLPKVKVAEGAKHLCRFFAAEYLTKDSSSMPVAPLMLPHPVPVETIVDEGML